MPSFFRWRDKPTPQRRQLNRQFTFVGLVLALVWFMSWLARKAGP